MIVENFSDCVCRPHISDSGSCDVSVSSVSLAMVVSVGQCMLFLVELFIETKVY